MATPPESPSKPAAKPAVKAVVKPAAVAASSQKKSGIRSFKPSEVIFHENDIAQSLFIIQTGQIRLYRPKGRGFVELAILRAGEVIGEMAYFDEKSRRRSCSAQAIVTTEVIEISFPAFEKTMSGLNPWFKTIINTLADRLRKTNERVKSLETNSVGFASGGKVADYVFFHNVDVVKILSTLYLALKTHADFKDNLHQIHVNKLKFYLFDVYNVPEIKWEEFLNILVKANFCEIGNDDDGLPKIIKTPDLDRFRSILVFFNTQRTTEDAKKLKISERSQEMLKRIMLQLSIKGEEEDEAVVDVTAILDQAKTEEIPLAGEDLKDAVISGLAEDIVVGTGNRLTCTVNYGKIKKLYPSIVVMNAVSKVNETMAQSKGKYD